MPPSATETVQQVVVPIVEKTIGTKVEEPQNTNGSVKAAQPEGEELPKLETNHKEPLKLSGALDKFESFDVTPVIGREYANVDLVEWLRAPNSDELIRDLAITSKLCDLPLSCNTPNPSRAEQTKQSLVAASSSSAPRTSSPTSCRRSSCSGSAS